ncbi:DNA topoisomerase II [Morganella phage vB_MmoM_MP1]|uniref:DNA topoisomerase (ATP-hydrolyzing) n=1 Tax=Morganella phage vB_MmoM_MP1 TaxID=1852628 RepID=A0A192YA35_9CAUD|nr:DNA topoisomerase II [Morganella phage vB_MmoM_MP1]ANM46417.1 DNA topoisomerase [Morganella phage vB_MmoM_MP1]
MKLNKRSLESIVNNEAKEYAKYVVEERAIPSLVDGFKPVHRFVIYQALQKAKGDKNKFHKLAGLSGAVAELGYHHGEDNAAKAGAGLANTWNNNIPFLEGQGSFGSRLVQKAGSPRYVFARISKGFYELYKDFEVCDKHEDLEHIPPKFYLPIIPTVLLNGTSGIAVGYATEILPHSLESLVECTRLAIEGKLDKEPTIKFPQFRGKIVPTETGADLYGEYELKGKTQLTITEIPFGWDRETYIEKVLDPLSDGGKIDYSDKSGHDDDTGDVVFKFNIKLKKDFELIVNDEEKQKEQIISEFKLRQKVPQYIVLIDENDGIKSREDFPNASDVIKYFVKVRMPYYQKRIDNKIKETKAAFDFALAKALFISKVLKDEIKISGRKKADVIKDIESFDMLKMYSEKLIGMNLYHITKEEADKLAKQAKELKKEHEYWLKTTPKIEYIKDLDDISI